MLLQFFMAEIPAVLLGGTAILPPEAAVKIFGIRKTAGHTDGSFPHGWQRQKGKAIEKSHTLSICPIQYTIIIFKRRS